MGLAKLALENSAYEHALMALIDEGQLSGPAEGITRFVIAKGEDALTPRQRHVFDTFVVANFIDRHCTRCGVPIPYCELSVSRDHECRCGLCVHHGWQDR